MEYRKRQSVTVGDDDVDGSNVSIPSKITDEVNDDEDSEQDPGKKSVFNATIHYLMRIIQSFTIKGNPTWF